jgi:hypothetical protein
MSANPRADRVVRSWLHEDRHEDATRVLNTALAEVDTTPQRRSGGTAWRFLSMNSNLVRVGLAAAAVVVIAIIAINLLPGTNPPGSGEPSASPSVEPSEAAPSTQPSAAAGLPEGPHPLTYGPVAMTVTIPARGWVGEPGGGVLIKNDNVSPPDGAGMIVWGGIDEMYVYGDPCAWSTTVPATPATTVDEAMAALAAQVARNASAAVDITLDGYAGKAITLHVPEDAVYADEGEFTECDQGFFAMFGTTGGTTPDDVSRYHQGAGQIDEVWILDVEGQMVVIDWSYYAETPQADIDEERAIVESTTFE